MYTGIDGGGRVEGGQREWKDVEKKERGCRSVVEGVERDVEKCDREMEGKEINSSLIWPCATVSSEPI